MAPIHDSCLGIVCTFYFSVPDVSGLSKDLPSRLNLKATAFLRRQTQHITDCVQGVSNLAVLKEKQPDKERV